MPQNEMPEQNAGPAAEPVEMFAIVDLLGRRRIAGKIREAVIAGAALVRIDYKVGGCDATIFVAPSSIYSLSPVSEAIVAAFENQIAPVSVYELTRAKPISYLEGRQDGGPFIAEDDDEY